MKLIMESWREYLTESGAGQSYSSVNLDDTSRKALLNHPEIKRKIEELNFQDGILAHHMTITMGTLKDEYGPWVAGENVTLTATELGWIPDKALAVRISGLPEGRTVKTGNPHVTIATPNGKGARFSNDITNWGKLESAQAIGGTVVEAVVVKKKAKKKKEKPGRAPIPKELAPLGRHLQRFMQPVAAIYADLQAGSKGRDDLLAMGLSDELADLVMDTL